MSFQKLLNFWGERRVKFTLPPWTHTHTHTHTHTLFIHTKIACRSDYNDSSCILLFCKYSMFIYVDVYIYFYFGTTANLASQEYYKKSVEVFRKHDEAVSAVGKPVGFRYMNLGGNDVKVDHELAEVCSHSLTYYLYDAV